VRFAIAALTAMALASPAAAQHQQHQPQHHQTPYAGLQQRPVKALSDQQVADLRAGRGMGLALAGELNGYPGPLHVLELADQLQLSAELRQRVQQLFDAMKAEATAMGETLIEQERALDREFAEARISPASLEQRDARKAARGSPEISSHHRRAAHRRSAASLRAVARLSLTRRARREVAAARAADRHAAECCCGCCCCCCGCSGVRLRPPSSQSCTSASSSNAVRIFSRRSRSSPLACGSSAWAAHCIAQRRSIAAFSRLVMTAPRTRAGGSVTRLSVTGAYGSVHSR
jgi:hypothetical protein